MYCHVMTTVIIFSDICTILERVLLGWLDVAIIFFNICPKFENIFSEFDYNIASVCIRLIPLQMFIRTTLVLTISRVIFQGNINRNSLHYNLHCITLRLHWSSPAAIDYPTCRWNTSTVENTKTKKIKDV